MRNAHALILVLLLASSALLADEPKPVVKAEIVVTPERGATERDSVAASVTVVTRTQLDALPAQSLAEGFLLASLRFPAAPIRFFLAWL